MSWLNLLVDISGGNANMQALLDSLKARQQERERINADLKKSGLRDALKPEGSSPQQKGRRIEPIATRAQSQGIATIYFAPGQGAGEWWAIPGSTSTIIRLNVGGDTWPTEPEEGPPTLTPQGSYFYNGVVGGGNCFFGPCGDPTYYEESYGVIGWQTSGSGGSADKTFVLPTGGASGILINRQYYKSYSSGYNGYTSQIKGYTNQGGGLPAGNCYFGAYATRTTEPVQWVGPSIAVELTTAFAFNDRAIRQIPVGAAAAAAIDKLVPIVSVSQNETSVKIGVNSSSQWGGPPENLCTESSTSTDVFATATIYTTTFPTADPNGIITTGGNQQFTSLREILFQGYGLGRLESGYHVPVFAWSPAIYTAFSNPVSYYQHPTYGGAEASYSRTRDEYLIANGSPLPASFVSLSFGPSSLAPGQEGVDELEQLWTREVTFKETQVEPVSNSVPVPADQLTPSTQFQPMTVYQPQFFGARYWAWDWGNPAYCREQALALGFSEEDLTP